MYKNYTENAETSHLVLVDIDSLADNETNNDRIDDAMEHTFQCGTPINGSPCTTTVISCPGGGTGCTPRKCPYHG